MRSQDLHLISAGTGALVSSDLDEMLWEDPSGPLKISRRVADGSDHYCLTFGNEISVSIFPQDQLVVTSAPDTPQSTIDHFLTDQILPRVLSERAELVVHSGAIRKEDCVLLLLGCSGSGKSTLATSFSQHGWSLMGDDAIRLSNSEGLPVARAVYPSLRLFQDSIDALFSAPVVSQVVAHYTSKQRIDLAAQHEAGPKRVQAMFVLGQDDPIAIRRLSAAQACISLVENSFALDPTDRAKARWRLERASNLAQQIPAFAMSYPRDYKRLPEVRAAILHELKGL